MSWLSSKFELSRHGDAPNLRSMEGMRGFAVFLVFLAHYVSLITPWITANSPLALGLDALHTIGNVGVDLFFVLSGYLIYGSMIGRPQNFLRFMRRRVARIYPAFTVVLAIYLLLSFLRPAESKIVGTGIEAWLYVLGNFLLLPGLFPIVPIITVAWSLSYEMLYYLVIPPLITVFGMRERSARWRVGFFLIVGAAIAIYCAMYAGHVRLIMFISGIMLHEAMRKRTLRAPASAVALLALVAGLAATTVPTIGSLGYTIKVIILFICFFIVCYACFTRPQGALARAFSLTPLRWLGNMSYSYYLLHGLALKIAFVVLAARLPSVTHQLPFFLGMLPLMFLATLLPAAALFLLVERPLSLSAVSARRGALAPAGLAGETH